jgi:DNA-binding XRE family transcriptional regulator
MTTMKLAAEKTTQEDFEREALTMALAIIGRRMCRLSAEDRKDLFELIEALPDADSTEERESIFIAMREILEQGPLRVHEMEPEPGTPGAGLQKWMNFIGGRIRTLRERAGLTQTELAARSGLPQSHISRLENAKHSPSHVTLQKIAQALGEDISELDPSI